jgi:predicted transcriptional regulator of viral defense system
VELPSALEVIRALTKRSAIVRSRDFAAHGIGRHYLRAAEQHGLIVRNGRGLYSACNFDTTEFHSFAEVAKRVPRGVICLLSALRFHEVTNQNPFEVWIAIGEKDRSPRQNGAAVRVSRFSRPSLAFGQTTHVVEGVPLLVFSVAKTVADCFKYRNKIGLEVALEALRDSLSQGKATTSEIREAAQVCRVANIMRPYLEAVSLGPAITRNPPGNLAAVRKGPNRQGGPSTLAAAVPEKNRPAKHSIKDTGLLP